MENDATRGTSSTTQDLERIKGIGPAFAQALSGMGITRFADLARYTPAQLADALLERAGVKVAAERIASADWIGQARKLAEQTGNTPPGTPEANQEQEENERLNWRQQAGFSLFFDFVPGEHGDGSWQTRVYHDESGEEVQFSGVYSEEWVAWVLARAELPASVDSVEGETEVPEQAEPETEPATPEPEPVPGESEPETLEEMAATDVSLDIREMQVSAATETEDKRLVTRVGFQVTGPDAERLAASHASYQVYVEAVSLTNDSRYFVESKLIRLEPGVRTYNIRLELPLPEPGQYDLYGSVQLLPPVDITGSYEGPLLRVVP